MKWLDVGISKFNSQFPAVICVTAIVSLLWLFSLDLLFPDVYDQDQLNRTCSTVTCPSVSLDQVSTESVTTVQPLSANAEVAVRVTMKRLEKRVYDRQSQANLYQLQLNKTEKWGFNGQHVFLSHGVNDGGLGNWMFTIASLYGVARSSQRIPSLFQKYWVEDYLESFSLLKINRTDFFGTDDKAAQRALTNGERGAGKFAYWLPDLNFVYGQQNAILQGYLQSWKYFDQFRKEVQSLFVFNKQIFDFALGAIWSELGKFYRRTDLEEDQGATQTNETSAQSRSQMSPPRLIGIHVRRGDITKELHRRHGHNPAPTEYLRRAVVHFQQKHPAALFLVISNDDAYCKRVFQGSRFMFLELHHEAVDLAILSLMDDIILSVGSYGWWGAYLSEAQETVYYKHWPRKGSDMAMQFNSEDYFRPSWTPME